ncbi:hypothetical protein AKJ16_DCAP06380 [Drosera capensis]
MEKKLDGKEYMRTAMLKHEEIFRQQVYELHRLYQIQKILMSSYKAANSIRQDQEKWIMMNRNGVHDQAKTREYIPELGEDEIHETAIETSYLQKSSEMNTQAFVIRAKPIVFINRVESDYDEIDPLQGFDEGYQNRLMSCS